MKSVLFALLFLACNVIAGPSAVGQYSMLLYGSYFDAESGQSSFVSVQGTLTIEAEEHDRKLFHGFLTYKDAPEVKYPVNGSIIGVKVRATVDGAVIEGTITRSSRGVIRKVTVTSMATKNAAGNQAVYMGALLRN